MQINANDKNSPESRLDIVERFLVNLLIYAAALFASRLAGSGAEALGYERNVGLIVMGAVLTVLVVILGGIFYDSTKPEMAALKAYAATIVAGVASAEFLASDPVATPVTMGICGALILASVVVVIGYIRTPPSDPR